MTGTLITKNMAIGMVIFTLSSWGSSWMSSGPGSWMASGMSSGMSILSAAHAETLKKIVILGDSLTEGYGVAKSEAYPDVLQKLLDDKLLADKLLAEKSPNRFQVVGAGISGSTTASGLGRLKWLAKAKPHIVVLALGSNDALRGIPVEVVIKNVEQMILYLKSQKIKCLLVGFRAPPNYGKDYTQKFDRLWGELRKKHNISWVPFLLEGVAGEKLLNLEDGIHPNTKGHQIMAKNIFKSIVELL